ncbi:hypothetical protein [Bifidobacterium aquikefiricola]|uniref:Uncharacterized protein n=1 Tax=Bifidobacterium aquikefiricola TaxID=3059038 RepID=A0AB39U573_9BIFI
MNATILQPTRRIVATTTTNSQYVVTDPGVLQLVDSTVKVTAKASNDDARVCLALGAPQDATGWLGGIAYTRITGLSNWTTLNQRNSASEGSGASDTTGFSDSDLWSRVVCGDGEATITTAQGESGEVLLIDAHSSDANGASSDAAASSNDTTDVKTYPARISMDWTRKNLPNYAMPFYFVGGLLVVAAILAASVFAIDPMRRRKTLDESKLKKIEETEMSVVEAFAGAMRPLAGEIRSSFKRRPDSSRRHAHVAASKRSRKSNLTEQAARQGENSQVPSTPRVIDVGSKNLVAVQQGSGETVHASAEGHTRMNHASDASGISSASSNTHPASGSADETAVISPEELQSYFARFTAETTGSIEKVTEKVTETVKDEPDSSQQSETSGTSDDSDASDASDTTNETSQQQGEHIKEHEHVEEHHENSENASKEQSTTENGGE